MRLLVIVPARGGSKGLPRKNARHLGDLALLGWTAEAVRAAGIVPTATILSTDDPDLAAIGSDVGLDVPFVRPPHLADDQATALAVIDHALDWYEREHGQVFDAIAWLQPTSPFRRPPDLAEAIGLLDREDVPAVIGVKDLHRTPTVLFHADVDRRLVPLSNDEPQTRRQDIRSLYTPNGALYVAKTSVVRDQRTLFPAGTIGIVMDQIASIDIDDATDWALAEAVVAAGLTWRTA